MDNRSIVQGDKFFLVVNRSGYFMKTRYKNDFDEISSWGGILFADVIKNSKTLFFQVGSMTLRKKICLLPVAKPQSQTGWFDVGMLEFSNGNRISKVWIAEKGGNYETL